MRETDRPVQVTILTGFLGAGKTTLLRRILANPQGIRFGVLINDFGAINIDAALVVETAGDTVALQNGCDCCTMRDELVPALTALLERDQKPERIVIEASGVSRPLPLVEALEAPQLAKQVALDGVYCLVDSAEFQALDFASTELAIEQAMGADVVVLNKRDLVPETVLDAIEATLRGPMPRLRALRTVEADVPWSVLFDAAPCAGGTAPRAHQPHGQDHPHDHGEEFQSFHFESTATLDVPKLRAALKSLPQDIMRAKGVFRGAGMRLVFQQVGRRSHLSRQDGPLPDKNAFVAIGRRGALDEAALEAAFARCETASV